MDQTLHFYALTRPLKGVTFKHNTTLVDICQFGLHILPPQHYAWYFIIINPSYIQNSVTMMHSLCCLSQMLEHFFHADLLIMYTTIIKH